MSDVDRRGFSTSRLSLHEGQMMKVAALRARLRELFTLGGLSVVAGEPRIIVERRRKELDGANNEFIGRYTQPRTSVATALQDLFDEHSVPPEQAVEITLIYGELYKPSEDRRYVQ